MTQEPPRADPRPASTALATTAPNPPDASVPDTPVEKKKSRVGIARVMLRGENVIYERHKLWPQGPAQTFAGQCAYAVYLIQLALENAMADAAAHKNDRRKADGVSDLKRELEKSQAELLEARKNASGGSEVIEARVADMYMIAGDSDTLRPAVIEILGFPFGEWAARKACITATVPQSGAVWENVWPLDEFQEHAAKLAADADENENETEDEEDDEEDGEEGDDA